MSHLSVLCVSACQSDSLCVEHTASPAKTAKPIELFFGARLMCVQGTMMGVRIYATWRLQLIDLCGDDDAACRYHHCSSLFTSGLALITFSYVSV